MLVLAESFISRIYPRKRTCQQNHFSLQGPRWVRFMKKFKNSRDTLKAGRTCLNLNWAGSARWRCLSCPASPSSSRRGSTASSATSHSASLPGTLSTATHRRKIKTEEKAKVIAAVWGKEMIQFLAALAILHQDGLKKKINRITAT